LPGPLELGGAGRLEKRRLACELKARIASGAHTELVNLLNHVARRDGPETWTLNCM
jgi:hypothetical protein